MTTMDADTAEFVKSGFLAAVPFARTLGVEFVELDHGRAVLRLPDNPDHHNHVGGPHAGAMFTLAESASGAIVIGTFGDLLDRAVPLAVSAEIRYRRLAMGEVLAEARLARPRAEVVAELDAGERPEFGVDIELRTAEGTPTGAMTVVWTLKPNAS
ncbi:DUF4442 domain-containing protein [Streptomonospora nanhaiensis]|uniref:Uncharacterized protein (TIGR00369 family) n=1 Tax=Streptomonospora nanhaiensis TaxID=1323731 RepID=A0A853BR78_9ACTN|nr:DUF4442 domain-containing protein [Streptomonospora nanhaiensis]MBV2364311.1 DUF4442 domain-containing protein [Streptomonospora nanhaiensis]MBX9391747.1 DUF4442 domain-containing protein [Streptomonospora nanhaiensis]NYI97196.1 uncharacterized protein (TIGR00369 family) [Streptomonospora nanhaiensis]